MLRRSALSAFVFAATVSAAACGGGNERLIVAAGTTVVDSGVVDRLSAAYEASTPSVDVSVVGRSTREVLDLGSRGAADVLISHAPDQEAAFMALHPQAVSHPLFSSRFLLAGPAARSRLLDGLSPQAAMREIADRSWGFVTRGDGSGTYEAELRLWLATGDVPDGRAWYSETGQGMGISLQVADQTDAFILVEAGSFLAAAAVLRLRPVELASGTDPENPYVVIVPLPTEAADAFVHWLLSATGRAELTKANDELFGSPIFIAG